LPNERSRFKTVHRWHGDIEENHREILLEQAAKGLFAGAGLEKVLPQAPEHCLESQQLIGTIVDNENVYFQIDGSPRHCGARARRRPNRRRSLLEQPGLIVHKRAI
jgi:hypothetical protein